MKTNDYRNTEYCPEFLNIQEKKKLLDEEIKTSHPRVKIMYNQVNVKGSEYNNKFREIYNHKCAYCGVSQKIMDAELYEIDHFVCESSFEGDSAKAGEMDNLVMACKRCNRKKKDFLIDESYKSVLNPDDGSITEVFFRDDGYYIKIDEKYKDDKNIKAFYTKLELESQVRRLDYLLMNMEGLNEEIKGTADGQILAQCIVDLQKKRNNC